MRFLMKSGIAGVLLAGCLGAIAQTAPPPKTWVDRDTGHRIFRVTDEPGSSGFYFNVNAYSPDGGIMVYTAPDGIHTMELAGRKTRLLIPNPAAALGASEQDRMGSGNRAIVVGRKTNSIFFSRMDATTHLQTIFKADLVSGKVTQLATLPARATISTVNADETLGAGVYTETEAGAGQEYGQEFAEVRPSGAARG